MLVTGSSRGIGRAIAVRCARDGRDVVVHYHRNRAAAEETLRLLEPGNHLLVSGDLGLSETGHSLIESIVRHYGRLDVLVNNAAVFETHPILSSEPAEWLATWRRTMAVNLEGAAMVTFAAARHMVAQFSGRIINISSRGAFRGEPDAPGYAASKAALNAFGQSLAQALAPYGILVFTIAPGWIETEMVSPFLAGPEGNRRRSESPLGRLGRPEEVANVVAFLSSGQADYLTGCIVDMNGASYLRT
jgi:NAD(P)-dependent dehydrogenase (short-subunit alcohol dehydrogenase family)